MENVSYMPDRLQRIASGLKADFANAKKSDAAWTECMVAAAVKVTEARGLHKNDAAFGKWWKDQGFEPDEHDRAAMVVMGAAPEIMRDVFTKTTNRSIRYVYGQNKERFGSSANPPAKRRGRPAGTVSKKPRIDYDPEVWEQLKTVAETSGISAAALVGDLIRKATVGDPIDLTLLSKTGQQKVAAAVRQETRRLQEQNARQFQDIIAEHIEKLKTDSLPHWKEFARRAQVNKEYYEKLINNHKPPLTNDDFMLLMLCVRGENASAEKRHQAGVLLNAKRFILTGKEE